VAVKRVRIREVAERAGVSTGTISNVLNHPESVSEPTRQHILKVMDEMNFVRDGSARQLRVGQSQTVGVIVRDISNPFYMELARGIEDRLDQENCIMMLCSSDADPDRESRFVQLFAEQGVRGVLITPYHDQFGQAKRLKSLHIPLVLLDAISDQARSVTVDHVDGGKQAVRHLLEQGHRRIGIIAGPDSLRPSRERTEGARQAVTAAGLDPAEVLAITRVDLLSADSGQRGMATLLEQGPLTAVCCVNDSVAMGALRELRVRRLAVPQDVAVVGYDDIVYAKELMVPLSSIHQPMHDLGWTAVEMLFHPDQFARRVSFQPQLVVRESSTYDRR